MQTTEDNVCTPRNKGTQRIVSLQKYYYANLMREIKSELNVTNIQLASLLGVSVFIIANIEAAKIEPSDKTIIKMQSLCDLIEARKEKHIKKEM